MEDAVCICFCKLDIPKVVISLNQNLLKSDVSSVIQANILARKSLEI